MDELIKQIEDYFIHLDSRLFCICNFEGNSKSVFIYRTDALGMVRVSVGEGENYGFISDLFVNKLYRGVGYGNDLLMAATEVSGILGVPFSQLRVLKDSWMVDWYKKNSFVPLFEEDGYIWMIKNNRKR